MIHAAFYSVKVCLNLDRRYLSEESKVRAFLIIRSEIVFEQARLKRAKIRTAQSAKNQKALTKLHAQVLRLNKTVKEASGQKHLELVKS
jgi:hypothetical protein